jgi:phenylacetate-CoA ligase
MDRDQFAAEVYRRVPAYRAFLDAQHLSASTPHDQLPVLTKESYLLAYPTEELCWDGSLAGCHLIGASSGFSKSGAIFWPKRPHDEADYLDGLDAMFVANYAIDRKPTLLFVCLALGTWIAGIQLASALRMLAASGRRPLTVSTPGLNLAEAVEIYARFGKHYEQVVWLINPSSVNLVAALLDRRGLRPPPASMSFAVVGEYYSEAFREKVASRFGHSADDPFCVWTGYGSADAGGIGVETRETIALRKHFYHQPALSKEFFGVADTPMLLAPVAGPELEIVDGNLVVTKDQMVPLVRYDTGDAGGVLTRERLQAAARVPEALLAALPDSIVYVYGRASDAVIFYGTNLMLNDVNSHLLALPDRYRYGGLFEVHPVEVEGVAVFDFTVYVQGPGSDALRADYERSLLDFLKERSLEFAAKYDALSGALSQPLITVTLRDVVETSGQLKHRFLVES